jgi:hypothetical protein
MVIAIALLGQPCELQSRLRQENQPMMFVSQSSMHEAELLSLWNLKSRSCSLSMDRTYLCRDESIDHNVFLPCFFGFDFSRHRHNLRHVLVAWMGRGALIIEDGMLVLLVAFVDLELELDVARSS